MDIESLSILGIFGSTFLICLCCACDIIYKSRKKPMDLDETLTEGDYVPFNSTQ